MEEMEAYFSNLVDKALPDLPEGKSAEVAFYLVNDVGVTSMERLELVREDDFLNANLLPAEARLCMLSVKPPEPLQQRERGRRSLRDPQRQRENATNQDDWNFVMDWDDIKRTNEKITNRLSNGKKLTSRLRREFVARVVHQVRTKVPGATRGIFVSVMKDIKLKYPRSFRHELAGGKVGKKSITKKLMDKYDNDKRPAPRRTMLETEAPLLKSAYGCVKWRAPLPDGQTCESQEQIRQELQQYFSNTRPSRYDWDWIEAQMKLTYSTQRKELNVQAETIERLRKAAVKKRRTKNKENQNPLEEQEEDEPDAMLTAVIADKWPFLFQARGMRMHFTELTGLNFADCIEKLVSSQTLDKLLEFCKESLKDIKPARKISKKLRSKLKKNDLSEENKLSLRIFCLIRMIVIFFKEDESELLLCVESTTLEDDVATVCKLPKTPTLIIAGDVYDPTKIFFSADGTLLGTAQNLLEGLELLFCSYFVLNLVYAPKIQITLEFIQRVIMEMIPAKGNKRPPKEAGGRYSSLREHAHLGRFSIKFEEFLASKDSSSQSSAVDNQE